MANSADQNAPPDPALQGQETPEDVVRKLMQAEALGESPSDWVAPVVTKPGKTRNKPRVAHSTIARLTAAPRQAVAKRYARIRTAILSYRPTPRHIAFGLLAVIVLTMPWLIPVLILLGAVVVVISYLSIGHDRSVELILAGYGWFLKRNPQGAEAVRSRAARFSAQLTKLLERLPDRWTSGLFLPDFEHPDKVPDKLAEDPFKRLAQESQIR